MDDPAYADSWQGNAPRDYRPERAASIINNLSWVGDEEGWQDAASGEAFIYGDTELSSARFMQYRLKVTYPKRETQQTEEVLKASYITVKQVQNAQYQWVLDGGAGAVDKITLSADQLLSAGAGEGEGVVMVSSIQTVELSASGEEKKKKQVFPVMAMQPNITGEDTVGELMQVNELRMCRWNSPRDAADRTQNPQEFPKNDPDQVVIRVQVPHKIGQGPLPVHVSTSGATSAPENGYSYNDAGADVELVETSQPGIFESKPIAIVATKDDDQWALGRAVDGHKNDPTFIGWPGGKLVCKIPDLGNATIEFPIKKFTHYFNTGFILAGKMQGADGLAVLAASEKLGEIYAPLHVQVRQGTGKIISEDFIDELVGTDAPLIDEELPYLIGEIDRQGFSSDAIKVVFLCKTVKSDNDSDAYTLARINRPDIVLIYLSQIAEDAEDAQKNGGTAAHECGHVLRGLNHTTQGGIYHFNYNGDWGQPLPFWHVMAHGGGNRLGDKINPDRQSKHWFIHDTDIITRKTPYSKRITP